MSLIVRPCSMLAEWRRTSSEPAPSAMRASKNKAGYSVRRCFVDNNADRAERSKAEYTRRPTPSRPAEPAHTARDDECSSPVRITLLGAPSATHLGGYLLQRCQPGRRHGAKSASSPGPDIGAPAGHRSPKCWPRPPERHLLNALTPTYVNAAAAGFLDGGASPGCSPDRSPSSSTLQRWARSAAPWTKSGHVRSHRRAGERARRSPRRQPRPRNTWLQAQRRQRCFLVRCTCAPPCRLRLFFACRVLDTVAGASFLWRAGQRRRRRVHHPPERRSHRLRRRRPRSPDLPGRGRATR